MKLRALLSMMLTCVGAFAARPAVAEPTAKMTEQQALEIGTEAYVYGYPLVLMHVTERKLTNVVNAGATSAPVNQFSHARELVKAGFTDVVAPNNDTLYSQAWLDLSREPVILHVPDARGRYYLLPMLSAWTDVFASLGSRPGTRPGDYAIVGPGFHGAIPAGIRAIRSPTNMAWILGRIYTNGTADDLAAVHAFQDELSLRPLSAYGKPFTQPAGSVDPGIDMQTPPAEQVAKMDASAFFGTLAMLMKDNPPATADKPMVAKLARLGFVPGQAFDPGKLAPPVAAGIARAPRAAIERIAAHAPSAGRIVNGWTITLKTGAYGTSYLQRAFVAMIGLGANLPADAVYPLTRVDSEGKRLNGQSRYVMHFAKGATPPVNGFWSLTMYDDKMFFVKNATGKVAIHSADKLAFNPDGSLDLYIQADPPSPERMSNWLPADKGDFVVMLRMYWPKKAVLDGSFAPPAVQRVQPIAEPR